MQLELPTLVSTAHPAAQSAPEAFTWAKFTDVAGDFAVNLTLAATILTATWFASKWASILVDRGLGKIRAFQHDRTLLQFAAELTRWVVFIVGLIAVLQRLGVQTASIIAVLGAASLAIGLALQGALSNVAAGVLMILLRPYRVGDEVEVAGQTGVVKRVNLFTTELATRDNRRVMAPNAKVMGEVVVNRTFYRTRRVDLEFDVAYEMDLDRVLEVMKACADADERVLNEPKPWAAVSGFKDSSVTVVLRAWAKTTEYVQVGYDLRKAVKMTFDREGIEMPYPRQVAVPPEYRAHLDAVDAPRARPDVQDQPAGRA